MARDLVGYLILFLAVLAVLATAGIFINRDKQPDQQLHILLGGLLGLMILLMALLFILWR